jgi:hypothetical protein
MVLQSRTGRAAAVAALVAHPLLILMYWWLYPAYGETSASAVLRTIDGDPSRARVADVFAYTGSFVGVAASLVLMTWLGQRASRTGWWGGALAAVGWIAVIGVLMLDVVASETSSGSGPSAAMVHAYDDVFNAPITIGLNAVAALHVLGGILIGVALIRTRLVPLAAGVVAALAPPVHLAANLAGQLWLDELTWIALAVIFGLVGRRILDSGREDRHRVAT